MTGPLTRFIPASAGNTLDPHSRLSHRPVHPRVCGEHGCHSFHMLIAGGSSPRLRGTLCWARSPRMIRRFIPASAGNTGQSGRGGATDAVHPRVCGEHSSGKKDSTRLTGSSPRLRGTRNTRGGKGSNSRFIPASAGNTSASASRSNSSSVHPRVCGEHGASKKPDADAGGSSPRLRGTLHGEVSEGGQDRFIPASAGNTTLDRSVGSAGSVHPRVCGEHIAIDAIFPDQCGSSPRLRGTPR